MVLVAPHPRFEVLSIAEAYPKDMAAVQEYVTSKGALYLDFNMAHQDLYDIHENDFIDATHLNRAGAERLTPIFADVVRRAESGEDVSAQFYAYDRYNEYLASLDSIYYVCFEEERVDGEVQLTAITYAGSRCQVEYAYEIQEDDGSWTRVRDWSADPECTLADDGYRFLNVRILARQAGATDPERYHYQTVTLL